MDLSLKLVNTENLIKTDENNWFHLPCKTDYTGWPYIMLYTNRALSALYLENDFKLCTY